MEIRVEKVTKDPELHFLYCDGHQIGCLRVQGNVFIAEYDGLFVYAAPTIRTGFLSGGEVEKYTTEGVLAVRTALEADLHAQSVQADMEARAEMEAQADMDDHIQMLQILGQFD